MITKNKQPKLILLLPCFSMIEKGEQKNKAKTRVTNFIVALFSLIYCCLYCCLATIDPKRARFSYRIIVVFVVAPLYTVVVV